MKKIEEKITKTRYNIIVETLTLQTNTLTKKIKDNNINIENLASASFTASWSPPLFTRRRSRLAIEI